MTVGFKQFRRNKNVFCDEYYHENLHKNTFYMSSYCNVWKMYNIHFAFPIYIFKMQLLRPINTKGVGYIYRPIHTKSLWEPCYRAYISKVE